MTLHDRHSMQTAKALIDARKLPKHALGTPGVINLSQRLVVFSAAAADIETLIPRARQEMGGGASNEVVRRIARHNPDTIWAIARRDRYVAGEAAAEGYVAFLMLNEQGVDQDATGQQSLSCQ